MSLLLSQNFLEYNPRATGHTSDVKRRQRRRSKDEDEAGEWSRRKRRRMEGWGRRRKGRRAARVRQDGEPDFPPQDPF